MKKLQQIVGENIKTLRISQSLTQVDLADKAGIHRAMLGHIERGERNISLSTLEKIANALGIEPNILLTDEERKKKNG